MQLWRNPIFRITAGLVGIVCSSILVAGYVGLIPDHRTQALEKRRLLVHAVATSFSVTADRVDRSRLVRLFENLAKLDPSLRSIAIRRADGQIVAQWGEHASRWNLPEHVKSTDSQLRIPVFDHRSRWGSVEASFVPLRTLGLFYVPIPSDFLLALCVGCTCTAAFWLYLKKTLLQLNPARAVPGRVRQALDTLAEGVLVLDTNLRIMLVNHSFHTMTGLPYAKVMGKQINTLPIRFRDPDASLAEAPWNLAMQSNTAVRGLLMEYRDDYRHVALSVSCAAIRDDDGVCRGVLVSLEDVTKLESQRSTLREMVDVLQRSADEIRRKNEELERLATVDPLTGCLNRRSAMERFERLWQEALERDLPLSALMVDVDHFKSVNDQHGHQMGDEVLRQVAGTLLELARPEDLVCRFGGEEFAVVLPQTTLDEAADHAEAVRQAIARLRFPDLQVTASLGVSARCQGAASPLALLEQADNCLYFAKRNGRNQVARWDYLPAGFSVDQPTEDRPLPGFGADPAHVENLLLNMLKGMLSNVTATAETAGGPNGPPTCFVPAFAAPVDQMSPEADSQFGTLEQLVRALRELDDEQLREAMYGSTRSARDREAQSSKS